MNKHKKLADNAKEKEISEVIRKTDQISSFTKGIENGSKLFRLFSICSIIRRAFSIEHHKTFFYRHPLSVYFASTRSIDYILHFFPLTGRSRGEQKRGLCAAWQFRETSITFLCFRCLLWYQMEGRTWEIFFCFSPRTWYSQVIFISFMSQGKFCFISVKQSAELVCSIRLKVDGCTLEKKLVFLEVQTRTENWCKTICVVDSKSWKSSRTDLLHLCQRGTRRT